MPRADRQGFCKARARIRPRDLLRLVAAQAQPHQPPGFSAGVEPACGRLDCLAVLATRGGRRTHYARFARCVQTTAPSQFFDPPADADCPEPLRSSAPHRRPAAGGAVPARRHCGDSRKREAEGEPAYLRRPLGTTSPFRCSQAEGPFTQTRPGPRPQTVRERREIPLRPPTTAVENRRLFDGFFTFRSGVVGMDNFLSAKYEIANLPANVAAIATLSIADYFGIQTS